MYFFLKKPKGDEVTSISLIYYVKEEGKNFKYGTGQSVHPENWDFNGRMPKPLRGGAGKANRHIAMVLTKYRDFLNRLIKERDLGTIEFSRSLLKHKFDLEFKGRSTIAPVEYKNLSVPEMVQAFIDARTKSRGVSGSWLQKYGNLKLKLSYFEQDNGPIDINSIDKDWLDVYCGYLRVLDREPFSPLNDNSLHRNINFLFTFLNWSRGRFHQLGELKNPVKKFQSDDVHLTMDEVRAIEKVKLPRESLKRARDLFLIGVYSGQRFSDYSVFEKADVVGDMIIKKAEKTEYESYIPLRPKLKKLLEKYKWKIPRISEQKFNPHVRTICRLAGIDDEVKKTDYRGDVKNVTYYKKHEVVGSHTARRTFITLSSENGMPDHIIMEITGIRDSNTLQKYKKTSKKSVQEAMAKVWG